MAASAFIASSGDPVLDRRLDWARAFLEEGDAAAAAELLAETVAAAAHFAAGWFLLGEARLALADDAGAAEAFGRARALDPEDALGAGLHLARLGVAPAGEAMSAAYVRTLFDQYAGRFDAALRGKLAYRGPELLHDAVARAASLRGRPCTFAAGLDLGCGTGLAGVLFRDWVARLDGVDLSPAMLAQAARLGLYHRLEEAELGAALQTTPAASLDLLIAADTLCYVADLAPVFTQARRVLAPGALFAFTLETHAGDGVLLRETLRYAHSAALARDLAQAAGLSVVLLEEVSTRSEKGVPVPGLICVLA